MIVSSHGIAGSSASPTMQVSVKSLAVPSENSQAVACHSVVGVCNRSSDARAYQAQLGQDISTVSKLGASRIPEKVDVSVPFQGFKEPITVRTRPNGEFRGKPAYDCIGLSFQTYALGISAPVFCSILVNIDRACASPTKAIEQAVISHAQAISRSGPRHLNELPTIYTVKAGAKGADSLSNSEPNTTLGYHRPPNCPAEKLYTKAKHGSVVTYSPDNVEVCLSSETVVKTTEVRLQQARRLAGKITFVLGSDGKQTKASTTDVEKVAQKISAFTVADMKRIEENGYKVVLVDPKVKPKGGYPGQDKTWDPNVGAYVCYQLKAMVVPVESLDKAFRGVDVAIHELGHVVSDCRVKDESRFFGLLDDNITTLNNDKEIVALHQAYAKRCGYDAKKGKAAKITNPSQVWSDYAVETPGEYLAEGIAFYKNGGASRQKLKDKDPTFHAKLVKLFPEG